MKNIQIGDNKKKELAAGENRGKEEKGPKQWLCPITRVSWIPAEWVSEWVKPQELFRLRPYHRSHPSSGDLCSLPSPNCLSTLKIWSKISVLHFTLWLIMYVMPWSHFCISCKARTTLSTTESLACEVRWFSQMTRRRQFPTNCCCLNPPLCQSPGMGSWSPQGPWHK